MRVQVTSVNPEAANNTLYVEYEKVGDEWVMRRWRIGFDALDIPNERYEGEWHKIHGNQKNPIGHMPISTRTLSAHCRGRHRKVEIVGKA